MKHARGGKHNLQLQVLIFNITYINTPKPQEYPLTGGTAQHAHWLLKAPTGIPLPRYRPINHSEIKPAIRGRGIKHLCPDKSQERALRQVHRICYVTSSSLWAFYLL